MGKGHAGDGRGGEGVTLLDARKLTDALVKLERACDSLPVIADEVRAEALGHLIIGANRSVYDTTPGAYKRTGELLRGLEARSRASRNLATVEVLGRAPYHAYVELGTGATALMPEQAQAYALANPNPAVSLYQGRSGVNYSLPGPVVAPAQAYAVWRLSELFVKTVRAAI